MAPEKSAAKLVSRLPDSCCHRLAALPGARGFGPYVGTCSRARLPGAQMDGLFEKLLLAEAKLTNAAAQFFDRRLVQPCRKYLVHKLLLILRKHTNVIMSPCQPIPPAVEFAFCHHGAREGTAYAGGNRTEQTKWFAPALRRQFEPPAHDQPVAPGCALGPARGGVFP